MQNKEGIRAVNVRVVAQGEDLGNGFCIVPIEWLPETTANVAEKHGLVTKGKCIISTEFINCPWHANAVYTMDFQTEYTSKDA